MNFVSYLTPVYTPAVGGAVFYVSLLGQYLTVRRKCTFKIITEQYPNCPTREFPQDGIEVLRLFPFRAGKSQRMARDYFTYAVQNIQFISIARFLPKHGTFFIHGSFFNNPTLLGMGLRFVRKLRPNLRLVLDLRDPKFPESLMRTARQFDATISCSRNISERLPGLSSLWEIPIMVEPFWITDADKDRITLKYGLERGRFIFNGSGFNHGKGIDTLVRVTRAIRAKGRDITLAVAGKRRLWNTDMQSAFEEGWLKPLGIIPRIHVRTLGASAWLDANLSTVDSLPRHSLEALAGGARVLLPPGVPEFRTSSPEHVADTDGGIERLATQATAIAEGIIDKCQYPWEKHLASTVIPQYEALLDSLASRKQRAMGTRFTAD